MKEPPELFDLRVKARSMAYLFTAGAGLGALTLVFLFIPGVRDPERQPLAGVP